MTLGPLVLEASALPTEPQTLPILLFYLPKVISLARVSGILLIQPNPPICCAKTKLNPFLLQSF